MTTAVPPDRLDALVDHIQTRLTNAVADFDASWRTPMLASLDEHHAPTLRTVVVRQIDPMTRSLRINTDRRSDKFRQISSRPRVELGFWDPQAAEQLRIAGRAILATDAATVDSAWKALRPEGRLVYRSNAAPGTPITVPMPDDADGGGRQALAVLTVIWESWDWLWLGPDGHHRARFRWSDDGNRQADWVVP